MQSKKLHKLFHEQINLILFGSKKFPLDEE